MIQGEWGRKVHLGNGLAARVPAEVEESWRRDPGGVSGGGRCCKVLKTMEKHLHLFIHLLLDEFLLSLYYMLDTVLGAAYTGTNTADLIPGLREFIVDQE